MTFSVIIAAYNSEATIGRCVRAVIEAGTSSSEIIVVNDGSTDRTVEEAQLAGARVVSMPQRSGPAAARNLGVSQATADVVVFVDSDVVVRLDTLGRLVGHLEANPELVAVFGSYDDSPEHPGFYSQYRNLLHHYVHQTGRTKASTFWAGCGALLRQSFNAVGGFDVERYPYPSIEDIELGSRLIAGGGRIRLDPTILVKHLKPWTWTGILKTDVLRRALPWSRLIAEGRAFPSDLNLGWSQRACGLGVVATVATGIVGSMMRPSWWWLITLALAVLVIISLNLALYRFFVRVRGLCFAARVIPMHLLYYLGSSIVFGGTMAACWVGRALPASSSRSGEC